MMRELVAGYQLRAAHGGIPPIMVRREAAAQVGWRAEGVRWAFRVALVLVVVAASSLTSANETGPILGFTGAPGEFPDGANCTYGPEIGRAHV